MNDRGETWRNGLFEIEVDVAGIVEFRGREWEVATAFSRGFSYKVMRHCSMFRDIARPQEYFFLAEVEGENILPCLNKFKGHLTLPEWKEALEVAFDKNAWGWVLWFDEDAFSRSFWVDKELKVSSSPEYAEWYLFLLPDGRGAWNKDFLYPFRCEEEAPFGEGISTEDYFDWVLQMLHRKTDCWTALKFARLNDQSKLSFALNWGRGSLVEFERVCRWIGHVAIDWDGEWEGQKLDVTVELNRVGKTHARSDAPKFWNVPDLGAAQPLWEPARKASGIEVKPSLRERPSVVHWFEEGFPGVVVPIAAPNAHERMEALMNLRTWAQDAGIEDELTRLAEGGSG